MADHEVSKIMWVAIVVALAASIFTIAKPEVKTAASGVFAKVEQVVDGINTGDSNEKPDPNAKYSVTGAEHSEFDSNKIELNDGNGHVLGHYSFNSETKVGKFAFDEEAAKDVDLTNMINIMLPGAGLNMQGSANGSIDKVLSVDADGKKTSNAFTFTIQGGQQFQISGQGEHQSLYGAVIEVTNNNTSMGVDVTRSAVTSHYEEVK